MEEKERCRWILNEYGYIDLSKQQDFSCPIPKDVKGFWLAYDEQKPIPKPKKHRKKVKVMETTTQEIAHVESSTMESVSVPSEPIVVPEPPKADIVVTMLVGAISGAFTSILMRMLKKKEAPKVEAPKKEESHTSCKTHNMKCETRSKHVQEEITKLNERIDSLEGTSEIAPDFGGDLSDLRKRVEKLESKKKK
jgi:hypothetical protein